jgi:hypothetical protein
MLYIEAVPLKTVMEPFMASSRSVAGLTAAVQWRGLGTPLQSRNMGTLMTQ